MIYSLPLHGLAGVEDDDPSVPQLARPVAPIQLAHALGPPDKQLIMNTIVYFELLKISVNISVFQLITMSVN